MSAGDWREGYALLAARVAGLPDLVRRGAVDAISALDLPARRVVLTGVGSSAAHARFLTHLLADHLGRDARAVPLSTFLHGPPPTASEDALVVFSQGLSPNARLALAGAERWRRVALVTAVTEQNPSAERRAALRAAREAGALIVRYAGEDEYGTLVRVVGPLAGYLAALALAQALPGAGRLPAVEPDVLALALERAAATAPDVPSTEGLAFVAAGTYGDLVLNLQYKVLEGMLLPMPPVWDLLHLAHGPFQEAFARPATFLALTRADEPDEAVLLSRFQHMLEPRRHHLVRLPATLPGPLAILEHEAMLNAILLRSIRERHVDQVRWPGRGRETSLYDVATPPRGRFDALTSPELAAELAAGRRTAVIALGSTEQHGAHLPIATDTLVADALAERLVARVGDAIQGPTLTVGCSREHLDFPGTLNLRAATFAAVLRDVVSSLRRHGFERVFLFSAHGGNFATLEQTLPALRETAAPMAVTVFADLEGLTGTLHREATRLGVSPEAAGHHAGEIETSILLALEPAAVRAAAAVCGLLTSTSAPQSLFYPSLRANAPSGVVGDPRGADAAHGARYLEVWVDLLAAAYAREIQ